MDGLQLIWPKRKANKITFLQDYYILHRNLSLCLGYSKVIDFIRRLSRPASKGNCHLNNVTTFLDEIFLYSNFGCFSVRMVHKNVTVSAIRRTTSTIWPIPMDGSHSKISLKFVTVPHTNFEIAIFIKVALGHWQKNFTHIKLRFDCIGSIISENFILTAARCVKAKRPPAVIRIGNMNVEHSVFEFALNVTVFEAMDNETVPDYHVQVESHYQSVLRKNTKNT